MSDEETRRRRDLGSNNWGIRVDAFSEFYVEAPAPCSRITTSGSM
jgi:hypothetical protein